MSDYENRLKNNNLILQDITNTVNNLPDAGGANIAEIINLNYTRFGRSNYTDIPEWMVHLDWSNCVNTSGMFASSALVNSPELDIGNSQNTAGMFTGCINLTNVYDYDTKNVTQASSMFTGCEKLSSIPNLNVNNVIYATDMFS